MDKILIVDDDKDILESLDLFFKRKGYETMTAENGRRAEEIASVSTLDAIVLDVLLPDVSGLRVCEKLRGKTGVPILFLSALGEAEDRVGGFLAGGDDYVPKPFSPKELELRVRRRIDARKNRKTFEIYRFDRLTVDVGRREASYDSVTCPLTGLEFDLLAFLAAHPNQVFSYDVLYDAVWRTPSVKNRHTLQVHVSKLRQRLAEITNGRDYIRTVNRRGYVFVPEGKTERSEKETCYET